MKKLWEATPQPVREALGCVLGILPSSMLLGRRFRRRLSFLRQSQWWPRDRIRELQLKRLQAITHLAYDKSDFYRRRFDSVGFHPSEFRSVEDIRCLPTIDRQTVSGNLDNMRTRDVEAPNVDCVSTGGSSGRPLRFYINADRSATEYAYLVSSWQRAGYKLGIPQAVFRGYVVASNRRGLRHEYDGVLRRHYYSSFHLTEQDNPRYLEHVASIGPCFLLVYPSSVSALARFVRRSGWPAPRNILGILAGSENVYEDQREVVAETFGARLFSWYGHSEKLVLSSECEYSTDQHVWPTYGYFELLDPEGNPVTTPGERGEIVGTGFINTVVPFIRYRTGDYATYVGEKCRACGREHMLTRDIRGHRTQEMLIAADNSEIAWTALNMHDDTFFRVRQFQFYQEAPGRALLRVIPANGFGSEDRKRILTNLGKKLHGRIELSIELVDSIRLSPNGKAIYVEQRIASAVRTRA